MLGDEEKKRFFLSPHAMKLQTDRERECWEKKRTVFSSPQNPFFLTITPYLFHKNPFSPSPPNSGSWSWCQS